MNYWARKGTGLLLETSCGRRGVAKMRRKELGWKNVSLQLGMPLRRWVEVTESILIGREMEMWIVAARKTRKAAARELRIVRPGQRRIESGLSEESGISGAEP